MSSLSAYNGGMPGGGLMGGYLTGMRGARRPPAQFPGYSTMPTPIKDPGMVAAGQAQQGAIQAGANQGATTGLNNQFSITPQQVAAQGAAAQANRPAASPTPFGFGGPGPAGNQNNSPSAIAPMGAGGPTANYQNPATGQPLWQQWGWSSPQSGGGGPNSMGQSPPTPQQIGGPQNSISGGGNAGGAQGGPGFNAAAMDNQQNAMNQARTASLAGYNSALQRRM